MRVICIPAFERSGDDRHIAIRDQSESSMELYELRIGLGRKANIAAKEAVQMSGSTCHDFRQGINAQPSARRVKYVNCTGKSRVDIGPSLGGDNVRQLIKRQSCPIKRSEGR